jgi:multidrug efflux system membrane fusion protein
VDPGNVVKAGETALVTVNSLTPIRATFTVPEQSLAFVQQQMAAGEMAVVAEVPGASGFKEHGKISFLDNTVDSTTGTIRLKAQFMNENKRLWPGQFVTLTLVLDVKKQAVIVPAQAVQTGQDGQFVFVVTSDKTAEVRPVVPGPRSGEIMVIDKGLRQGEEVIVDGHMRVIPGGKVEIKTIKKSEQDGQDKMPKDSSSSFPAASKAVSGQ